VEKQLQKRGCVRCAARTHIADALSNGSNSSASFGRILAAGVLDDGLLEHLPELSELRSESDGQACDGLERSLDYEPVVLRRLIENVLLGLLTKVLLARVTLGDDSEQVLAEIRYDGAVLGQKDSWSAELECGGDITVDVGDSTPDDR
jgi:hypothetical protein